MTPWTGPSAPSVTPQGGTAHTLTTTYLRRREEGPPQHHHPLQRSQLRPARYHGRVRIQRRLPARTTTTITLPGGAGWLRRGLHNHTHLHHDRGEEPDSATPALGGIAAETTFNWATTSSKTRLKTVSAGSDTIAGGTQYNNLNQIAAFQQVTRRPVPWQGPAVGQIPAARGSRRRGSTGCTHPARHPRPECRGAGY